MGQLEGFYGADMGRYLCCYVAVAGVTRFLWGCKMMYVAETRLLWGYYKVVTGM